MLTTLKPNVSLPLPSCRELRQAATEAASDVLLRDEGLRQIARDLREARDYIDAGAMGNEPSQVFAGLYRLDGVLLVLEEAGYTE